MAARKPKGKGKPKPKDPKIPKSAAEKEASVQLTIARQLGVSQTRSKQAASSRGAFRERKLRASGDMSRYNLARFKDDPFPTIPTGRGGGGGGQRGGGGQQGGQGGGTGARTSPRPKKPKKGTIAGEGGMRERGELKPQGAKPKPRGTISNPSTAEDRSDARAAYLKEQARKRAAAAAKKLAEKEATPRARGNTSTAL